MQNVIQDPIVEAETVAIISDHKTSQCVSMRISKRIITNIFSSEIVSSRSAETEEDTSSALQKYAKAMSSKDCTGTSDHMGVCHSFFRVAQCNPEIRYSDCMNSLFRARPSFTYCSWVYVRGHIVRGYIVRGYTFVGIMVVGIPGTVYGVTPDTVYRATVYGATPDTVYSAPYTVSP